MKIKQQIDKEFTELFGAQEIQAAQPLRFKKGKIPTNVENLQQQQMGVGEPKSVIQQQQQIHQEFPMKMKTKNTKQIVTQEQQEIISKKPFNVKDIRQASAKNNRAQEIEQLKQQQGNLYQKLGLVQENQQQQQPPAPVEEQQTIYAKPDIKPSKEVIQATLQKNQKTIQKKELTYESGKITEEERLQIIQKKKIQQQAGRKKEVQNVQIEDDGDDDYSNDIQFDESDEEFIRPGTAAQKFQFKPKQDLPQQKKFLPPTEQQKIDANKNLEESNLQKKKEKELAYQRAKQPTVTGMTRNQLRELNQDIPIPQFEEYQQQEQQQQQQLEQFEDEILFAPQQKKKKGLMVGQKMDERQIVINTDQESIAANPQIKVSSEKVQQQRKRCRDLHGMVFLEEEPLGDMLVMQPTGEYEQYVNKIKKSVVKNFAVQCNDDNVEREVQTDEIECNDFVNQCPDDRIVTLNQQHQQQISSSCQIDMQSPQLNEFLSRVSPIVEELLDYTWLSQQRQGKNMRDTDPQFTWLNIKHKEINQNLTARFIYSMDGDNHNIVYIVIGSSYVIEVQSERIIRGFKSRRDNDPITTLHRVKYLLFFGTESGGIEVFDLRNYNQSFFHEPVWDTCIVSTFQELQSHSDASRVVAIQSQVQNNGISLIVLQQFSRIELWNVVESDTKEMKRMWEDTGFWTTVNVTPSQSTCICGALEIDPVEQLLFVTSGQQVWKVDKTGNMQPKAPRIYSQYAGDENWATDDQRSFPTTLHCIGANGSDLFFVGYSDGSVAMFSKQFSVPVFSVANFTDKAIMGIVNSFIELKVKGSKKIVKYEDFSKLFVIDSGATLFIFDFAKDMNVFFQFFLLLILVKESC